MDSRELFMKLTAESKIIPLPSTLFDEEYRNLSQGGAGSFKMTGFR